MTVVTVNTITIRFCRGGARGPPGAVLRRRPRGGRGAEARLAHGGVCRAGAAPVLAAAGASRRRPRGGRRGPRRAGQPPGGDGLPGLRPQRGGAAGRRRRPGCRGRHPDASLSPLRVALDVIFLTQTQQIKHTTQNKTTTNNRYNKHYFPRSDATSLAL